MSSETQIPKITQPRSAVRPYVALLVGILAFIVIIGSLIFTVADFWDFVEYRKASWFGCCR